MPQFKDSFGRLTEYAFRCGYVERKSTNPEKCREEDLCTEIYHESDHYQVCQYDRREGAKVFRVFWESFSDDEFAAARARFDAEPGELVMRG